MTIAGSPERPNIGHSTETTVAPRYNLGNDRINRRDFFSGLGQTRARFLEYPAPTMWQFDIARQLLVHGLLLGGLVESDVARISRFRIPAGARPVTYDASVLSKGLYSYDDSKLFGELGSLLRQLRDSLGENKAIRLNDNIRDNVALVDFSPLDQRQLFFVPGVELSSEIVDPSENLLGYYKERLRVEFDDRFTPEVEASLVSAFKAT